MIFVAGGTSFLGKHTLYHLMKRGVHSRATFRSHSEIEDAYTLFDLLSKREHIKEIDKSLIDWVQVDITDYEALSSCMEDISTILYVNDLLDYRGTYNTRKKISPQLLHQVIDGTETALAVAQSLGISHFIYLSSTETLQKRTYKQSCTESDRWTEVGSKSIYQQALYHTETAVWRANQEGLHTTILHLPTVCGVDVVDNSAESIYQRVVAAPWFYPRGYLGYVDVRDVSSILIKISLCTLEGNYIISAESMAARKFMETICHTWERVYSFRLPLSKNVYTLIRGVQQLARIFTAGLWRPNLISLPTEDRIRAFSSSKLDEVLSHSYINLQQSIRDDKELIDEMRSKKQKTTPEPENKVLLDHNPHYSSM